MAMVMSSPPHYPGPDSSSGRSDKDACRGMSERVVQAPPSSVCSSWILAAVESPDVVHTARASRARATGA